LEAVYSKIAATSLDARARWNQTEAGNSLASPDILCAVDSVANAVTLDQGRRATCASEQSATHGGGGICLWAARWASIFSRLTLGAGMPERLPPLNALRTFEVAARHLNFTVAAEELHVTAAAVSHQIRSLEDHLGVELFHRSGRSLTLTTAGQGLVPEIQHAFARIQSATRDVRVADAAASLTITVPPSFAAKWLIPRLPRFRDRYPNLEVKVTVSSGLADFGREDLDLAIRYGRGGYAGLHTERLLSAAYYPVCGPRLAAGPPPLQRPGDLRHAVLLHDEIPNALPEAPRWEAWLRAAGVSGVDASRGPQLNNSFLTIEMAILGVGVALAIDVLAATDVAKGRLVRPFDVALKVDLAFFLVCPPGALEKPRVRTFRKWLQEEATASGTL
jgi:LysR family transcriptional regulator, glycine cleavage system transcriptional activator